MGVVDGSIHWNGQNNFVDFIQFQANKLGMTREEYMAHYGSANSGINEADKKPGPDPYHRGLDDEEVEDKEDQIKKQAKMDDDDPDAYKEMPGDKEAREKGEVKTSKATKAYNKLYGEDLDEGTMSDIHQMAGEVKSEEEFIKRFFKEYGAKIKKTKDSEEWAKSLYNDMNESKVNERSAMGFDAMTGLYYFDGVPFTQDRLDQVIGWLKGTTIKAGKSLPKQFTYKPAIQIEDEVGGEQVTFDTDKIKFLEYIRKEMKGKLASDADFNESNELSEAKFPGRKGDFIKWKDQYFDIKKTAGSTAYVKFPHTASHAFSQVWDDEVTLADEKHRGKKVWLMESNQLNEEKAEGDRGPIDNPDIETALKKKADDTGVPIGLIRIVMRRGMAAWKTGHRPGAGQEQWGYARVNSFLTKQPGTWGDADSDVAKEVRDGGHDSKLKKA